MNVLITGGNSGQLKWELHRTLPDDVVLVGNESLRLDITSLADVMSAMQEHKPECIINAAAYTAVDTAETDADRAFAVNHIGVKNLCEGAQSIDARLIHVSTDFVFGKNEGRPLNADSPTEPCSVYGDSKLAGERAVMELLPHSGSILRTAWVYSSFGQNFVKTMLRVMGDRDAVGVVADQVGSPTWANGLARALWSAARHRLNGIHHWTGGGVASWYDFAVAIYEEGRASGLLDKETAINPLRTDQYPTAGKRPSYSVMDTTRTSEILDLQPEHWRIELRHMIREMV